MQPTTNRKFAAIIAVAIVLVLVGSLVYSLTRPKPNVTLDVAPKDAIVTLNNGKRLKSGEQHIAPGKYTATARFEGFTVSSQDFTVKSSGVAKVSLVLDPLTNAAAAYLKKHPEENLHREAITGQKQTSAAQAAVDSTPLIKELPYIGAGLEFQIDYGTGIDGKPKIIITALDDPSKADARTWITNQGYDVTKLDIEYHTTQPGTTFSATPGA